MDRFRRWMCTAVMVALLASLAATPVMAKNRTITGRGIEQPGGDPGLDATGEPDMPSGGGLPRGEFDSGELRLRVLIAAIQVGVRQATGRWIEEDTLRCGLRVLGLSKGYSNE